MYHYAPHAFGDSLLFITWTEGLELWRRLASIPGVYSIVVMPTHVHIMHPRRIHRELAAVMSAFARWRNHHRQQRGRRVWRPLGPPTEPYNGVKQRRDDRYVGLNPCRERLVGDPLAWPLSTHRDRCGLVVRPAVRRSLDPAGYHRYVSSDPTVHVAGTPLPDGTGIRAWDASALPVLRDAVSSALRMTIDGTHRKGRARSLLLRCARVLTTASLSEIGAATGVSRQAVGNVRPTADAATHLVARIAGDPRFGGLYDVDLRRLPTWHRHRTRS